MLNSCACMLPINPNFDYTFGPTSNSHYSLNIIPNHAKVMLKLKTRISNFQTNKPHLKILCVSKVIVKKVNKGQF